jgi:protein tyrosine phosphatase type 4A
MDKLSSKNQDHVKSTPTPPPASNASLPPSSSSQSSPKFPSRQVTMLGPNGSGRPMPPLARIFSTVEYGKLRFLILDCPTQENLNEYLKELQARNVTDVVRVCEPTYDKNVFIANGIKVHDWAFKDGGIPPPEVLSSFLSLCAERFGSFSHIKNSSTDPSDPVIAVHCVAGLGRAPVLVAVSLIEAGLTPLDAVDYIRKRRRGAFNSVQLQYLVDNYKKRPSSSWKMGEAAKAFFGRRGSTPPPLNQQTLLTAPAPAVSRSESIGSDRSDSLGSVLSLKESFSKVWLFVALVKIS